MLIICSAQSFDIKNNVTFVASFENALRHIRRKSNCTRKPAITQPNSILIMENFQFISSLEHWIQNTPIEGLKIRKCVDSESTAMYFTLFFHVSSIRILILVILEVLNSLRDVQNDAAT